MTDRTPAQELADVLREHRIKRTQQPAMPPQPSVTPEAPVGPQEGQEGVTASQDPSEPVWDLHSPE